MIFFIKLLGIIVRSPEMRFNDLDFLATGDIKFGNVN